MTISPLSSREFFRDPVGYAASHRGDLIEFASPTGRSVLVRDPDEVWRILVTDADAFRQGKWKHRAARFVGRTLNTLDGDEHRSRRLLIQPVLDRRRVETFAPAMVERALLAQKDWRDGARVQLRSELDRLSLTMAGDVLLSVDLEREAPALARALATVMSHVPRLTPPLPGTAHARALGNVRRAIERLLAERRSDSTERGDLLDVLRASKLPEQTIVGEITAFLLAAVDEPPSGLAAAVYLLGRDADSEKRFHTELDTARREGSVAGFGAAELPFLDAVLREALRLLPPARHLDRCPVAGTEIAGRHVPAGTNVLISPLVTHREPSLYEHAGEFVPERWLGGTVGDSGHRGAYLPFGAGPHTCIGEPLARLIMSTTLATLGSRWRLGIDDGALPPVPRSPELVVTLKRRGS